MNWKLTILVSGTGVVATWLASGIPPAHQRSAAPAAQSVPTANGAGDILREAEALAARIHPPGAYHAPTRNPFAFEHPRAAAPRAAQAAQQELPDEPPATVPEPPMPGITLAGIAEDVVDGTPVRTAVLSTPQDVLLVKQGDMVGDYAVTAIAASAVELTRVSDGAVVRLAFRP